jgi:hypothetical protein
VDSTVPASKGEISGEFYYNQKTLSISNSRKFKIRIGCFEETKIIPTLNSEKSKFYATKCQEKDLVVNG